MEPSTPDSQRPWGLLLLLVLVVVLVHLLLIERWGYHRDELYFIECGRHLALGYVDHSPMVPWLAHLVCGTGECSLVALRLPSVIARALTVVLTGLLVWELGGRRFATLLAGTAVIIAPAYLRMGKILCIPVFEPIFWTGCALMLTYLIHGRSRKWWLGIGLVAGLGLLTKHTMLLWGVATLFGIVMTPLRRDLRTPWPWLGGLIAFAVFVPQLLWQAQHDWATLEFLRNISQGMLAQIPRHLFVLGQLLYMHPFTIPLWLAGLAFCFSSIGERYRIFGWIFVVSFAVLFIVHSKPYYLAAAYPMLFAAGAVWAEHKIRTTAWRTTAVAALVAGGLFTAAFVLPILPLETQDKALGAAIGSIVPPIALTHDLHDEYGWKQQAQTVARVLHALPADERDDALVLTANYGQASAINFFGPALGLPRAVTGHMTYYLWGVGDRDPAVVLSYGFSREWLQKYFRVVEEHARINHPLANKGEQDLPVYVCRDAIRPLREVWPEFKVYHHVLVRDLAEAMLEKP